MSLYRPSVCAQLRHQRATQMLPLDPSGIGAEPDPKPPIVHYQTAAGQVVCKQRGNGYQPKTRDPQRVTCPGCLKIKEAA